MICTLSERSHGQRLQRSLGEPMPVDLRQHAVHAWSDDDSANPACCIHLLSHPLLPSHFLLACSLHASSSSLLSLLARSTNQRRGHRLGRTQSQHTASGLTGRRRGWTDRLERRRGCLFSGSGSRSCGVQAAASRQQKSSCDPER
jgi:hypothetical protein